MCRRDRLRPTRWGELHVPVKVIYLAKSRMLARLHAPVLAIFVGERKGSGLESRL